MTDTCEHVTIGKIFCNSYHEMQLLLNRRVKIQKETKTLGQSTAKQFPLNVPCLTIIVRTHSDARHCVS